MQQRVILPAPDPQKWFDCWFCLSRETMREDVIKETGRGGKHNRFAGMPYWQCDSCKMTLFVNRKRGHLGVNMWKEIYKHINGPHLRYLLEVAQDQQGAQDHYINRVKDIVGGLRDQVESQQHPVHAERQVSSDV